MTLLNYVGDEVAKQAKAFEKKIQKLSPEAGIIFVSVNGLPTKDGKTKTFEVRLGVHRGVGECAGIALIKYIFKEETDRGFKFLVNAHQGVSGAYRANDGDEEAS